MHDYMNMLNARDGGIGGSKMSSKNARRLQEEKGVECYESFKGRSPSVITLFHRITLALIPKAAVDHIPVLSMLWPLGVGGRQGFPWIFNPPATYWDGLSIIFRYIGARKAGFDKLKARPSASSSSTVATAASRCRS